MCDSHLDFSEDCGIPSVELAQLQYMHTSTRLDGTDIPLICDKCLTYRPDLRASAEL